MSTRIQVSPHTWDRHSFLISSDRSGKWQPYWTGTLDAAGVLAAGAAAGVPEDITRRELADSQARAAELSLANHPGQSPRLGGWMFPVLLFGWVGGLVGWLWLRDTDRRRANHVGKWGLIWTGIMVVLYLVLLVLLVGALSLSS